VLERFFFDSSAFIAMIRKEASAPTLSAMLGELRRSQCHTSVLVVYELYRGLPQASPKLKAQVSEIESLLEKFTRKSVFHAQAMAAARLFRYSKGAIDPILAAQCFEGAIPLSPPTLQILSAFRG
jgi:predicted nucleic acid-binding protein